MRSLPRIPSLISRLVPLSCRLLLLWDGTAAAAIVFQKPLLKFHSPVVLSTYVISIAAVALAVVIPCIERKSSEWSFSSLAQLAVLYCAVYNTCMNWGDAWAVTIIPASMVSMWLTLEPIFTALLSAIFEGDTMTGWEFVGSGLTCLGLVVVLAALEDKQLVTCPPPLLHAA